MLGFSFSIKTIIMGKTRCKLSKKDYLKKEKSGTDYFCKKCGREANKMKKLCKGQQKIALKKPSTTDL
jgi:hypothetical protein